MVEENEIRAGISFYERARLAAEAAKLGIYPDACGRHRGAVRLGEPGQAVEDRVLRAGARGARAACAIPRRSRNGWAWRWPRRSTGTKHGPPMALREGF
jgi:hypothetical protein